MSIPFSRNSIFLHFFTKTKSMKLPLVMSQGGLVMIGLMKRSLGEPLSLPFRQSTGLDL